MENASKALIIAGAILVSILIIGLGMTLYNNAKSTADNASLTSVEVQQYNAEFTAYDGQTNVKGSNVQQLIKNVLTHNRSYSDDSSMMIDINVDATGNVTTFLNCVGTSNDAENACYQNGTDFDVSEYNDHINTELKKVKTARTYKIQCGYDKVTGYVVAIRIQVNNK